jgi:hypothetical protein
MDFWYGTQIAQAEKVKVLRYIDIMKQSRLGLISLSLQF